MALTSPGDSAWRFLVVLYLGGIVSANALASKLSLIGGVTITVGALAIPAVYLTTDVLNEIYGPAATRQVVWMGFWASALFAAMAALAVQMPASSIGASEAAFAEVFSVTPRIVAASMAAYLTSSLVDVRLFQVIKRLTGDRAFWLRKNGSTAVSQALDTAMFVYGAFWGVLPSAALPGICLGQFLVKISFAPLGTPLSYLVIRRIRK